MLTLKQASEQTGKTKQAIQQAIKKGNISAKKNDKNEWCIDPAELFRVYDPIKIDTKENTQLDDALHLDLQVENKILQHEVKSQDEKIKFLEQMIEDLKLEKEDWKKQAQTLLLKAPEKPVEKRKGFLARFVS